MNSLTLLCGALFFSFVAQAEPLFDQFSGVYKVDANWCVEGDLLCPQIVQVEFRQELLADQLSTKNYVIETTAQGQQFTTLIYQGQREGVTAKISGTIPTDANWSEETRGNDKVVALRSISVRRATAGAPMMFSHDIREPQRAVFQGRYHLVK